METENENIIDWNQWKPFSSDIENNAFYIYRILILTDFGKNGT